MSYDFVISYARKDNQLGRMAELVKQIRGRQGQRLLPDGRAIITQANGQVCFLQLYHGNHPISIEELERMVLENDSATS